MEPKVIVYNGKETNYTVSPDGIIFNLKTKKVLKGTYARNEYHSVQLTINGKPKTFMTHRLVAEAFVPNPNNYNLVDHIDQNKHNNYYTNLRWCNNQINANNISNRKKSNNYQICIGKYDTDDCKPSLYNPNYYITKDGKVINKTTNRILSGSIRNGYTRVSLGDTKKFNVHVLVYETFKGKISEGLILDHIDGNKANNCLDNLKLCNQSDNMKSANVLGHKRQVKIKQYDKQGNFIKEYISIRQAANEVNGNESAIKQACDRLGTSAGYFWIRNDTNVDIETVLLKYYK